jgi:hypothetical protein
MADPNIGQLVTSTWTDVVQADPQDNFFPQSYFLSSLKAGKGFMSRNGGSPIEVHLEYAANPTVAAYAEWDPVSTSMTDVFDSAQYNWKLYGGSVGQSELEDAINQGGGGKFDLLAAKLRNLKSTTEYTINVDLLTSTGSGNKLHGLPALIPLNPATGTVGGINRANFTFWRSNQASGAKTSTAYDNLISSFTSMYNTCAVGVSGTPPTDVLTDKTVFEAYEGKLVAIERIVDKKMADIGFKNDVLKFKGASIGYDASCTAGYAYFYSPEFIKLVYQKGRWQKMFDAVEGAQFAKLFKTASVIQLIALESRRLGVVTGIS